MIGQNVSVRMGLVQYIEGTVYPVGGAPGATTQLTFAEQVKGTFPAPTVAEDVSLCETPWWKISP